MNAKKILILGSTGSIGKSACNCVRRFRENFTVTGVGAGSNADLLAEQIKEFSPKHVYIADSQKADILKEQFGSKISIYKGKEGLERIVEEADYDILLNVASWADARASVWRMLIHARAIENLAYCVGVNRIGTDGEGYTYRGDSMVVDPKGTAIAMANPNEEQTIFVQLKKSSLNEFRKKFSVGAVWDSFEIKL